MYKTLLAIVAVSALTAGCARTAVYYSKHTRDAQQKLTACVQSARPDSPGCEAAAAGFHRVLMAKATQVLKRNEQP
ncbi:MAG: hypothetical protein P8076_11880 [Gammaproteobacteria bacterium]|jgi:hypothetical protein